MRIPKETLFKLPLYQSFRYFGYPKMLPLNYTFIISTRCNSHCLTCNIRKQKHDELTLTEWKKIFQSVGSSPFWVTVAGGEPFLQKHLAEMIIALDQICHPTIINIPTNSLLGGTIRRELVKILEKVKPPQLIINLSLDGVGEVHDEVRGTPGNFNKVMQNYKNLKKIQKQYPNLVVGFGTVISNYNIKHAKDVIDLVFKLEPDQYLTEIAEERVGLGTVGLPIAPSPAKYSQVVDYLIEKMKKYDFTGIGRLSRPFRFEYYQFVKDWLAGEKVLPDYAGFASCEISSWGEVWPSCIKGEKMGNLRDVDYNFKKIWFSKKADKIRKEIKKRGTSYPLANAFYSSAICHWPTFIKVARRVIFP